MGLMDALVWWCHKCSFSFLSLNRKRIAQKYEPGNQKPKKKKYLTLYICSFRPSFLVTISILRKNIVLMVLSDVQTLVPYNRHP